MHSGHLPTTCSHVYSKLGFPVFCPNFVTSLNDERIKKDKFRFNIYGEKIEINLFLVKSTLMSLPYTRPMLPTCNKIAVTCTMRLKKRLCVGLEILEETEPKNV